MSPIYRLHCKEKTTISLEYCASRVFLGSVLTHVHVRQRSMSVFSTFPLGLVFCRQGFPLNFGLKGPGALLSLPRQCWDYRCIPHTDSFLYMGAEDQTWVFILYRKQTTEPFSQPFCIIFRVGFQTMFSTIFTADIYTVVD